MSLALATAIGFGTAGCIRKTFDVKVIEPVPPETIAPAVAAGPLSVRFAAMWDEDWQLETFEANTTMAGVLVVRSHIENRSGSGIALRKIRVSAVDGHGRAWKRIDGNKARKRIEKFYGVRLRSKVGDRAYREVFAANVLDEKTVLPAGGQRQGLIFFEMPTDIRRAVPVTITAADERR